MFEGSVEGKKSLMLRGTLVKQLRLRIGWTQEELAERTGLSDRSIRSAEAGKPLHLKSVRALCDVFNKQLVLSLTPVELSQLPDQPYTSHLDAATALTNLIHLMYAGRAELDFEDLVAEQIVYSCEVGTLLSIDELRQRSSALQMSYKNLNLVVRAESIAGEFAAASWSLVSRGESGLESHAEGRQDERHGCTCIRMSGDRIVEAWDYPACNPDLETLASAPEDSRSTRVVRLNGDLVRAQRIARALTQEELAELSGLSIRLVRSAERGCAVSRRSSRLIAEVLCVPAQSLEASSEQTVSQSPMALRAKEYLEEVWNNANYQIIHKVLAENFRFHHERGVACNREEMVQRIMLFRESFDDFDLRVVSSLDFGRFVICKWRVAMTHIGTWCDIEPTHKRVWIDGASWANIHGDRFGDAWDFWSPSLVVAQLTQSA